MFLILILFFKNILLKSYLNVGAYVWVCAHGCGYLKKPEVVRSSVAGDMGRYKLLEMDASSQI